MKNFLIVWLSAVIIIASCTPDNGSTSNKTLSNSELNNIALVGGTLISSMEEHAFFETSLTSYYSDRTVGLRNVGWPADDVFGLARSQFGSAQNTRSWQPPSAEQGFGSRVLMQQIKEVDPNLIIIGYGTEAAFAEDQQDIDLFKSGYGRLLDFVDSLGTSAILLSPPKHEKTSINPTDVSVKNKWLGTARDYIQEEADERGYRFIDLFEQLITAPDTQIYTQNGIQLNEAGYHRMSQILIDSLIPDYNNSFKITLDSSAQVTENIDCNYTDLAKTLYGVKFKLTSDKIGKLGEIKSKEPVAIYVDGELYSKSQDTINTFTLSRDENTRKRLTETIKEKNRLYRYKLRPLNEAYIYLFRKHEMGHLSYEMDDLATLVKEKEVEIKSLLQPKEHFIELEMIKPWIAPKEYAYDEVPKNIPIPNIESELAAFNISSGMEMNCFAADPMIANPINVNWDKKGRAWVATSSIYPHIVPGREPNDKIIILEDTDQDGVADKHTVFAENLLVPHSVMPVEGGAYVTATTQLLFLADTDGDDVADETRVVFDGFGNADIHHTIHGLRWTPWGDLHFTQSIYINSFVESAFGPRILNGSGTWSFRPETERLEIFSRGLVNPWGEAFDEWGQAFATDGAGGSGVSHIFPESAHQTAVGANKVLAGLNTNKPKHTAAEVIYSPQLPDAWQGDIISNDYRANRTVRYKLKPNASSYESAEVETIINSDHRSYRPVDIKTGPDGSLYIVDWYNPIIDHGEVDFHHPVRDKVHGRIWRMSQKSKTSKKIIDFSALDNSSLLELLKAPEQHTRMQANRMLVENKCSPQSVVRYIKNLSRSSKNYERNRLEGLWLLSALNHYEENLILSALNSRDYRSRGAAVRILSHWNKQKDHSTLLTKLINDKHPQVRLETLTALREMKGLEAAEIAIQSLDHPMDQNLEYASWLTIKELEEDWIPQLENNQPLFGGDINKQMFALLCAENLRVAPLISKLITHEKLDSEKQKEAWIKMAKIGDQNELEKTLEYATSSKDNDILRALANAPKSNTAIPSDVNSISKLLKSNVTSTRRQALSLIGRWKIKSYSEDVNAVAISATDGSEKLEAMKTMVSLNQLEKVKQFATDGTNKTLATSAMVAWIQEDPESAADPALSLLSQIDSLSNADRIFNAFRGVNNGPEFLTAAIAGKTLPEEIASAGLRMAQTSGLNLFELEEELRNAGNIKALGLNLSQEDKEELIQDAIANGEPSHGRQIYRSTRVLCGSCHKVRNEGGLSGPDLSAIGSFMTPSSILESILNPNAEIKQNYETVIITKTDGEILSGVLHRKTSDATLLRQANSEVVAIPNSEIEETDVSPVSLMPAGLTAGLHRDELRDLLNYLINLGVEN